MVLRLCSQTLQGVVILLLVHKALYSNTTGDYNIANGFELYTQTPQGLIILQMEIGFILKHNRDSNTANGTSLYTQTTGKYHVEVRLYFQYDWA